MSCGTCGIQASNTMQGDTGVPAGAPTTRTAARCPHCQAFMAQDSAPCANPRCPTVTWRQEAHAALRSVLAGTRNFVLRRAAAAALGAFPLAAEDVPALVKALQRGSRHGAREAAEALGRQGDDRAALILRRLFPPPAAESAPLDSEVVEQAIAALAADAEARQVFVRAAGPALGPRAVPVLARAAHRQPAPVRAEIAHVLGQIGGQPAAQVLRRALTDRDPKVRVAVIQALGQMKEPDGASADLWPMLADADRQVREATAQTLGRLGETQSLAALAAMLVRETQEGVALAAGTAIGQIGGGAAEALLTQAWTAATGPARLGVLRGLGRLGGDQAVALLRAALADPSPRVRLFAVRGLGDIGTAEATLALTTAALPSKDLDVQRAAVAALDQIGGELAARALQSLATHPQTAPALRTLAQERLGGAEDERLDTLLGDSEDRAAATARLRRAVGDASGVVRLVAVHRLGHIGGAGAVLALEAEALPHPDPLVQQAAVRALGRLRAEEPLAARALQSLATHPQTAPDLQSLAQEILAQSPVAPAEADGSVPPPVAVLLEILPEVPATDVAQSNARAAVVRALGRTRHPAAVPALGHVLHTDRGSQHRCAAARSLGHIGGDQAVAALQTAATRADGAESTVAIETLGQMRESAAFTALQTIIGDRHDHVRSAGVKALAQHGNLAAIPLLLPLLADESRVMQGETILALARLGGTAGRGGG